MAPSETRIRYDEVRSDRTSVTGEYAVAVVDDWTSGELAMHLFGGDVSTLDALALAAMLADEMAWILWSHVDRARYDGRTWDEIGAALGVSRQAAVKRFRRGSPPPPGGRPRS